MQQNAVINDALPMCILTDSIRVKPNLKLINGNEITFTDGMTISGVDVILKATGFNYSFPFIPNDLIKVTNNYIDTYGYVWPPNLCKEHASLALIGCVTQVGAVNPIVEMQCRWATRVFKVFV